MGNAILNRYNNVETVGKVHQYGKEGKEWFIVEGMVTRTSYIKTEYRGKITLKKSGFRGDYVVTEVTKLGNQQAEVSRLGYKVTADSIKFDAIMDSPVFVASGNVVASCKTKAEGEEIKLAFGDTRSIMTISKVIR